MADQKQMNRRDFLKVITAMSAAMMVPSLIPADAKLVVEAKNERIIGNIIRTIDWHEDRLAFFVNYHGRINNSEHYYGMFVENDDKRTLLKCNNIAMQAFKGTAKPETMKLTEAQFHELQKIRGDFPPYGV